MTSVDATAMNPGFLTFSSVHRDTKLQSILQRRVIDQVISSGGKDRSFKELRFALVDLTGSDKHASPQYAGFRDTEQRGLGSMAKLACMYAAYQLKFDLEELSRTRGLTAQKPLFEAARQIWSDTQKRDTSAVTQFFPDDPKIERLGKLIEIDGRRVPVPRPFSSPDLEQVFDVLPAASGAGAELRFKGSDKVPVDPSVPGLPAELDDNSDVRDYDRQYPHGNLAKVRKLSFAERFFLMIDASDNPAAQTCIQNISFLYIISSIWQSGFYSPSRGGGLWEGGDHFATTWHVPPVPAHNPQADFVSGTAASVAALVTLIEQDRLVSKPSCAGMKSLLNKQKPWGNPRGMPAFSSMTRSPFKGGLDQELRSYTRLLSKLGIGQDLVSKAALDYDCAIIEREVSDPLHPQKKKTICYVAAGFDDPTPHDDLLYGLITAMDDCILENNGLKSP